MGWIEVKGLEAGWWKHWKLWWFFVGASAIGFCVVMFAEKHWHAGLFCPVFFAAIIWGLVLAGQVYPRRRWDTERGEYVEYDLDVGGDRDSGGDCGD